MSSNILSKYYRELSGNFIDSLFSKYKFLLRCLFANQVGSGVYPVLALYPNVLFDLGDGKREEDLFP